MSNDERFVKIDYLTLEVGDSVYWLYGASYELLGKVSEFTSTHVYVGCAAYSPQDVEEYYTLNKNFYGSPLESGTVATQNESAKTTLPKKVLTNEEIYEMLISDVSLLGLSKKAVRKIEKAVLIKLENLGKLH